MRLANPLFMRWIPVLHALSGCAQLIGIDDLPDVPADAEVGARLPTRARGMPASRCPMAA